MANKKEILKNITNYTPEEIADAVRNGVVSMYELGKDTEGAFTPLLKKRVKELLEQAPTSTIEQPNENITEIEESTMSNEPTIEDTPIPDELEVLNISKDSSLPIQTEQEITPTHIEEKPGMFRNPFSFSGRIRRTEYGLSIIICFFINLLMEVMVSVATESNAGALLVLYLIILIPYLWFLWAQGAKRCHDRGNSGWYQIIPFYEFWMLFAEGETGTNEYGNSPK